MPHVLVDPSKSLNLDGDAGLLHDLATNAIVEGFTQLKHSSRGFPVTVVAALNDEDGAGIVHDDTGNADRMHRRVSHDELLEL